MEANGNIIMCGKLPESITIKVDVETNEWDTARETLTITVEATETKKVKRYGVEKEPYQKYRDTNKKQENEMRNLDVKPCKSLLIWLPLSIGLRAPLTGMVLPPQSL